MSIADAQLPLWPVRTQGAFDAVSAVVRHSRRARRVAVRIDAGGRVELVVPRGVSEARARSFLASRADWVAHHLHRRRAAAPPEQAFPPAHIELPALGERWRVFLAGGAGRLRLCQRPGSLLEVRGQGDRSQWRRLLQRWLIARAQQVLATRVAEEARCHGFSFRSVSVRRQRTRWGSCSTRGAISLNLCLLFQAPAVLRYLLCHELAHTEHMNHSARFWLRVEQCEPQYRALDAELLRTGWSRVPQWVLERA
ncbi:MAG TPA: SprT family zinc-dependent metalloprotease [Steroidobacteraceae bacterium]|nr:SprT family zinc-dependent metalloprotease [Steroidobacteraceae bacterium]